MLFYIQVDSENVIWDAITYPHGDYIPVELPLPLPDGFIGGWHRWVDGAPVFDQERYDALHNE